MTQASARRENESDTAPLRADIDQLRQTLAELTRVVQQTGRDGTIAVADDMKAAGNQARAFVEAGTEGIARAVRAKPALACGVALGIGTLIGAALLRRG
ncbi:hypothetical protein [Zavarzinia aquatilis]|nr:hypothetical protein [Zavarzinia aquatilis]